MYYLIISFVLLFLIYSIECKKFLFFKSKNVCFFQDSIKIDFNIIKILAVSFCFVSLVMIIILKMEQGGFLSFQNIVFKLKFLPYILYSSLIVPVVEEYFYRFLPYSFGKYSNILIYVLIVFFSSLVFTYFHSLDSFASVFVFIMAVIFSVMFLKTKNICYPIISHAFYNLFSNVRLYIKFDSFVLYFVILIVSLLILIIYKKRKGD